ncbi:MAG TPA: TolC family protein [Candidatus Eisenbacteria bacterium]
MKPSTLIRTLALGAFLATAAPAPAATAAERSLTLDDAIGMALRKNEDLVIERESLGAAKAAVTGAKGAYDPLIQLDGSWSKSTEPATYLDPTTGTPYLSAPENREADAGVSIRQLLPTGGSLSVSGNGARSTTDYPFALLTPAYDTRVGAELRQPLLRNRGTDAARLSVRVAKAGRRGAVASLRRAVTETVAAVERAYWTLVDARRDIEVRQEAVRLAQEQLQETQSRVETGSVPRTELAQPQAELERRRGDLLAAGETLSRAENALKVLILDGDQDPLWSDAIDPVEDAGSDVDSVDVASALRQALATRPELEIANALIQRRHAETAFARDGIWPSLDVVVSYDRYGLAGSRNPAAPAGTLPAGLDGDLGDSFHSLGTGDYDAARVALVLGLPIGNREARGSAEIARRVERQAETDLVRIRKTIRAEVLDAAAALDAARQRIEAAKSGREAAEVQLAAERDRYATGLSTNFLVLTRQNDLSRARLDEISALTDYRTARTEMARATGSLIERHHIDVGEPTR